MGRRHACANESRISKRYSVLPSVRQADSSHPKGTLLTLQPPTVLLTGFEPFTTGQGIVLDENPTAMIVRKVAAKSDFIQSAVLPVSYKRTPAVLLQRLKQSRPKLLLGLGYAPHRSQIDIEAVALNVAHAERGDNDGQTPFNEEIVTGGPNAYRPQPHSPSHLNFFRKHDLPARISFHAGTFLCNLVFYMGCHEVGKGAFKSRSSSTCPPWMIIEDLKPACLNSLNHW